MKQIISSLLLSAVFATSALAQASPAAREPLDLPADYPKPGAAVPTATHAPAAREPLDLPANYPKPAPSAAPAAPVSEADIAKAINKLVSNKKTQQQMGQMLVIGNILGCTQKTAGRPATEAFYKEMQEVGKTAETYCKQGHATEARALLLSTFAAKKDDKVVNAALSCYDEQKQNVAALGGAQVATDAEHYARWLRDPQIAKTEMKESDICRKSKKS